MFLTKLVLTSHELIGIFFAMIKKVAYLCFGRSGRAPDGQCSLIYGEVLSYVSDWRLHFVMLKYFLGSCYALNHVVSILLILSWDGI